MTTPYYITTAISYPNGRPHVGHAYEAICADAIARFRRMQGRDVRLLTGTDEHGLKMAQAARARGLAAPALADEMSSLFRNMADALNISYDRFIRTTDADHHAAAAELWRRMVANGDVYPGRYEGWYSVRDEAFYADDELVVGGEGTRLSPQGTPVEWTVEESWFFRLSAYADRLLAHYAAEPGFVQPEARRNEVVRFVEGGLADLSISRTSFDWGVPVPDAPGHVMYVWVDALTNYLTGSGWPGDAAMADKWWPADLHVIGKDIVRFHAVYWPAFLMAAGLPLPRAVFGHGFVLHRGEKMSKSSGNVADPHDLVERYGVDGLRYFLLREVSFGQDGGYSDEAIVTRVNADLANGLGNLAQRCLSMIAKQCDGRVPPASSDGPDLDGLFDRVTVAIDRMQLHRALEIAWEGVAEANRWFADRAPWALRKTDPAAADAVLYATAEAVRRLALLVRWAIPASADRLLDQLGQGGDGRDFAAFDVALTPGAVLPPPEGVFPRLDAAKSD